MCDVGAYSVGPIVIRLGLPSGLFKGSVGDVGFLGVFESLVIEIHGCNIKATRGIKYLVVGPLSRKSGLKILLCFGRVVGGGALFLRCKSRC